MPAIYSSNVPYCEVHSTEAIYLELVHYALKDFCHTTTALLREHTHSRHLAFAAFLHTHWIYAFESARCSVQYYRTKDIEILR